MFNNKIKKMKWYFFRQIVLLIYFNIYYCLNYIFKLNIINSLLLKISQNFNYKNGLDKINRIWSFYVKLWKLTT